MDGKLLTKEGRQIEAKHLKDKENKQVLVCQGGFLDQVESVPVPDAVALNWFFQTGGVFPED